MEVEDVDDQRPEMGRQTYVGNVAENSAKGTVVLKVCMDRINCMQLSYKMQKVAQRRHMVSSSLALLYISRFLWGEAGQQP